MMLFKLVQVRCNIAFQPGSESKNNNWYSLQVTELWELWVTWSISQPGPFTQVGLGHSPTWSIQETRTQSMPVEKGKHYHGKPRLWMIRLFQTSSHCEKRENAILCRLKAKGQGDLIHGTGASTFKSKMYMFIRYWKNWQDVERKDKNNSWAGRNPLQWKIYGVLSVYLVKKWIEKGH